MRTLLAAALGPITPLIARQVHLSFQAMSLTAGMANAGYATGTVLAVLLAQHLPQRRMMILYAACWWQARWSPPPPPPNRGSLPRARGMLALSAGTW